MAFMSYHSKDNPRTQIEAELIEDEDDSASDFAGIPVLLTVDGLHLYLRKVEAERLWQMMGQVLQELDRRELNRIL